MTHKHIIGINGISSLKHLPLLSSLKNTAGAGTPRAERPLGRCLCLTGSTLVHFGGMYPSLSLRDAWRCGHTEN